MRIEWGEAELQRHIHPSGGYTKHSKVYQLLIDELQRMGNGERRAFLNFVTACPHLPPVGLSTLEIEVPMCIACYLPVTAHYSLPTLLHTTLLRTTLQRTRTTCNAPTHLRTYSPTHQLPTHYYSQVIPQQHGAFPTAQTCGNKLCLPDYDSPEALRTGLAEAFANADYGGLHEVGGLH